MTPAHGIVHHVEVAPVASEGAACSRWLLAVFAAGIPLEVTLVERFGSTSQVLGVPVVLAAAWQAVASRRVRTLPSALIWFVALTAWAATGVVGARDQKLFSEAINTRIQLLALLLLGWQVLLSVRDVRAVLVGFLAGCTWSAADVWRAYLFGREVDAGGVVSGSAGVGRFAAEGFDPNDTAAMLAVAIPVAAYLAFRQERRWHRLALAYIPLAGTAIALTASRGGTLAAAAGIAGAVALAGHGSRGRAVLAVLVVAVGAAAVGRFVPLESLARIATIGHELQGSTIGNRGEIWRAGLHVLESHPLAGVGAGGFRTAVVPKLFMVATAHNTLLATAVDLGAVGLLLFLAAFASVLRQVTRAPPIDRTLAWSLLLTWGIGAASLGWEVFKITYFVLLIGAALGALPPERTPDHARPETAGWGAA
jgi:O-antigen ligase